MTGASPSASDQGHPAALGSEQHGDDVSSGLAAITSELTSGAQDQDLASPARSANEPSVGSADGRIAALPHQRILEQASFTSRELASQVEGVQDVKLRILAVDDRLVLESSVDMLPTASLPHVARAMEVIVIPALERTLEYRIAEKKIHYRVAEDSMNIAS